MARKIEEHTFKYEDDNGEMQEITLTFTQFKPSVAIKMQARFAKIFSGPAGKLLNTFIEMEKSEADSVLDVDLSDFGGAIESLGDRLDEDHVVDTLNLLFKSVLIGNKTLHVDHDIFVGNTGDIFKVAKIALEVNFGDFFAVLSGLGKRFQGKLGRITTLEKPMSSGISGE